MARFVRLCYPAMLRYPTSTGISRIPAAADALDAATRCFRRSPAALARLPPLLRVYDSLDAATGCFRRSPAAAPAPPALFRVYGASPPRVRRFSETPVETNTRTPAETPLETPPLETPSKTNLKKFQTEAEKFQTEADFKNFQINVKNAIYWVYSGGELPPKEIREIPVETNTRTPVETPPLETPLENEKPLETPLENEKPLETEAKKTNEKTADETIPDSTTPDFIQTLKMVKMVKMVIENTPTPLKTQLKTQFKNMLTVSFFLSVGTFLIGYKAGNANHVELMNAVNSVITFLEKVITKDDLAATKDDVTSAVEMITNENFEALKKQMKAMEEQLSDLLSQKQEQEKKRRWFWGLW